MGNILAAISAIHTIKKEQEKLEIPYQKVQEKLMLMEKINHAITPFCDRLDIEIGTEQKMVTLLCQGPQELCRQLIDTLLQALCIDNHSLPIKQQKE